MKICVCVSHIEAKLKREGKELMLYLTSTTAAREVGPKHEHAQEEV